MVASLVAPGLAVASHHQIRPFPTAIAEGDPHSKPALNFYVFLHRNTRLWC